MFTTYRKYGDGAANAGAPKPAAIASSAMTSARNRQSPPDRRPGLPGPMDEDAKIRRPPPSSITAFPPLTGKQLHALRASVLALRRLLAIRPLEALLWQVGPLPLP